MPYTCGMTPEELRRLSKAVHEAQRDRDAAIVQAAEERIPKHIVCDATGLSKERIRRIERAGGAPKREAGRPVGAKQDADTGE